MDSSGSSKPRKGLRKLMDRLTVSRSRSRSLSPSHPSQADPKSLTPSAGLGAGSGATVNTTSPAILEVPVIVEPTNENDKSTQQGTRRENRPSGTSPAEMEPVPIPSKAEKPVKDVAWNSLRTSLRLLHESSGVFPALSSAAGVLLSCVDGFEAAAKHRDEYEELATTLSVMINSLEQYTGSMLLSGSMTSLLLSLERQAIMVQTEIRQAGAGGFRDASASEETLLRHYRKIQSLFQQLQTNASMSTWNLVNEQSVNMRLDGLRPVKQAMYDSDLSTEVSRRSCTGGTRTAVLDELVNWLQDSSSASVYWMNGMAGTGKTTIAYSFCERVEKRKQLAASFFCTRNAVDCRNTSRIIPTIAYQLARYSIPYKSALSKVLGENPDIGSKHTLKQFEQLLKEPLQQAKDMIPEDLVVVIDALDECEDRNGIERTLEILLRYAKQLPLKFLITSRPEPEIYNKMGLNTESQAVIHLHDIESSLVQADIELYLTEELVFMSPQRNEIQQLAQQSGCLFIYAATLVRYILYGKRVANPRQRLQSVLGLTSDSTKKHAEIDALYTAILESALHEAQMEEHEIEDVQTVLRTVLFAQEPIDINTIAVLGGLDDSERVLYALQPLRSVIHQSERTGLVSTLHASFPDYLLSHQRSRAFYCDAIQYNQLLAQRCFGTMESQLRFNICALQSSFVPDDKVEDLEARVKTNITPTLGYVCQYWANHLGKTTKSSVLSRMLVEFLSDRLLFWMEVLNLLKMMHTGIDVLQKTRVWVRQTELPVSEEQSIRLVEDSYTFVTSFAGSAASKSTPHIYISCLPFCSRSSQVYQLYWKRTRGLLELKGTLIDQRGSAAISSWDDIKLVVVDFSPDGTQCLAGLRNDVVILNVYNGATLVGPLVGHTERVIKGCFSADGKRVVSAAKDGTIRIWDAYNGALILGPLNYNTSHIRALEYTLLDDGIIDVVPTSFQLSVNNIRSIGWSPDGTRIVASFWKASTIYVWDANTGVILSAPNDHPGSVNLITISPDGTVFASATSSGTVRLWNVRDGTPASGTSLYRGHSPYNVRCVAFTPDNTRIASSARDIQVWRISDGTLLTKISLDINISSLAVSPDSTQVASGSEDGSIRIWSTEDGKLLAGSFYATNSMQRAFSAVIQLMYTPESSRLIACTTKGATTVWPVQDICLRSYASLPPNPTSELGPMLFCTDGTRVLTRYKTELQTVRSWDVHDGSFTEGLDGDYVFPDTNARALVSPDGKYTATLTEDGRMRQVIDSSNGLTVIGPSAVWINHISAQFSGDSTKVVTGSIGGTVEIWDLKSQQIIAGPFSAHSAVPGYVALSSDGSLIASHSSGGLRITNTQTSILDIPVPEDQVNLLPNSVSTKVYEGWSLDDGWVTNSSSNLLFFLPFEFIDAWPSPYTSLIVVEWGTVQVPKQTVFLGELWHRCYIADRK